MDPVEDEIEHLAHHHLARQAPADFQADVSAVLSEVAEMLAEKNARYGDSALNPVRCFSRSSTVEQLKVRLDDKISRLMRGSGEETEDVEMDLIGYLVLLRIARRRHLS